MTVMTLAIPDFPGGMMSIFLMGVYDPATYQWCTVTKCGIGFDDKTLEQLQKDIKVDKISKVCPYLSILIARGF